jgi:mercuric ion transport protein
MLPLALFLVGASGPWIGNLTQLAPYQPYFIAVTLICLGSGYWLVYRSHRVECAEGGACGRPAGDRFVKRALAVATVLVAAAIAFNVLLPVLNS